MRRLALLAALAPAPIFSAPTPDLAAAPVPSEAAFAPPDVPLILTRTLHRALPGGQAIVATRRYEVRIVRADGDGGTAFRVDGRLLSATVDAPPALAALAEIERQRSDEGLFPLRLDSGGMIVSAVFPFDRAAAGQAGAAARRAIAGSRLNAAERGQAEAFVGQVIARGPAGSGGRWPSDLFNPRPGTRTESAVPGSGMGRVTTTVAAARSAEGSSIERTVMTDTGADRRTTREIYLLARAPS